MRTKLILSRLRKLWSEHDFSGYWILGRKEVALFSFLSSTHISFLKSNKLPREGNENFRDVQPPAKNGNSQTQGDEVDEGCERRKDRGLRRPWQGWKWSIFNHVVNSCYPEPLEYPQCPCPLCLSHPAPRHGPSHRPPHYPAMRAPRSSDWSLMIIMKLLQYYFESHLVKGRTIVL